MIRFVLKHSLTYTIAGQIPMFANLLLYPFIAEFLTTFDYYVFGTALGYLGLVNMMGDLGMTALFQNSFYKHSKNYPIYWSHYLGFMFRYRFFISLAGAGVVWYALYREVEADQLWIIMALVITPMLLFEVPRNIGSRLLQFQHRHHIVARIAMISGGLAVITTFVAIYIYKLGYIGFFISSAVSAVFQGICFAWILHVKSGILPQFQQKTRRIKKWLKIALPIVPHSFTSYLLSSSDRVLLNQNLGNSDVTTESLGMYNVAYSFSNYFAFFNAQLNAILSPIYFSLFRDQPENSAGIIRRITYMWLWALLIGCTLAGLWSKEVFAFFFMNNTSGLKDSYTYIVFILFSMSFRPFYLVAVDYVIFQEKTTSLYKITTAGSLINVVLNLALIPFFGVHIAVYTTYLAYAYIGISGHHFKKTSSHINKSYNTIPYFIFITALAYVTSIAVEWHVVYKAAITIALSAGVILWYVRLGGKAFVKKINELKIR